LGPLHDRYSVLRGCVDGYVEFFQVKIDKFDQVNSRWIDGDGGHKSAVNGDGMKLARVSEMTLFTDRNSR
jgi:hypothetical protein